MACEYSGRVREAFRKRGHDAWSCDLEPTDIPGQHIQGDVLEVLDDDWDILIAHPPCTYLANSGAKHLYKGMKKENGKNPERWRLMREGGDFFMKFLKAKAKKKAVENPVMHGPAQRYIKKAMGMKEKDRLFTQFVQPWWFGDPKMKATGLVLFDLPPPCDDEQRRPAAEGPEATDRRGLERGPHGHAR